MAQLTPIELGGGAIALAGEPGASLISAADGGRTLIEECFGSGARAALLYDTSMPPAFFDLSSGVAGDILQRLRNYRLRLALVCPPGGARLSSRFAELLADERAGADFGIFADADAALAWLRRHAERPPS